MIARGCGSGRWNTEPHSQCIMFPSRCWKGCGAEDEMRVFQDEEKSRFGQRRRLLEEPIRPMTPNDGLGIQRWYWLQDT